MNSEEVAQRLGIDISTLWRFQRSGLIRCYRLGHRTIRFDEEQVQEYLASPLTIKASNNNSQGA